MDKHRGYQARLDRIERNLKEQKEELKIVNEIKADAAVRRVSNNMLLPIG